MLIHPYGYRLRSVKLPSGKLVCVHVGGVGIYLGIVDNATYYFVFMTIYCNYANVSLDKTSQIIKSVYIFLRVTLGCPVLGSWGVFIKSHLAPSLGTPLIQKL